MNTEKRKCVECKWSINVFIPRTWSENTKVKLMCGYYELKRNAPYWVISQIHYMDINTDAICATWAPKNK